GMAAGLGRDHRWAEKGLALIDTEAGLAMLDRLLGQPAPQVSGRAVRWRLFLEQFPVGAEPALLAEWLRYRRRPTLPIGATTSDARVERERSDILRPLAEASPAERRP